MPGVQRAAKKNAEGTATHPFRSGARQAAAGVCHLYISRSGEVPSASMRFQQARGRLALAAANLADGLFRTTVCGVEGPQKREAVRFRAHGQYDGRRLEPGHAQCSCE
jgi:hypothetical protein